MISTIESQQEGCGFDCGPGGPFCELISGIGISKVSVCECECINCEFLSLFVVLCGPVLNWRLAEDVPCPCDLECWRKLERWREENADDQGDLLW